jgi:hypothetical protein
MSTESIKKINFIKGNNKMGYAEERYKEYQERMKNFSEIYNKDTNEGVKHVTGFDSQHCAYRYTKIHGAVEMMGGWANCAYWMQNHAANYFRTCEKLEKLLRQTIQQLPKEERKVRVEELDKVLKNFEE